MRSEASAGADAGRSATTGAAVVSSAATTQETERLGTGWISQISPEPISPDPRRDLDKIRSFSQNGQRQSRRRLGSPWNPACQELPHRNGAGSESGVAKRVQTRVAVVRERQPFPFR